MKYISYSVFAYALLSGIFMHAMDDERTKMSNDCVKWSGQINQVAERLPLLAEDMFKIVSKDSFVVPEELKSLGIRLKKVSDDMLTKVVQQKIPVIEQKILAETMTLFTQELFMLRPENPGASIWDCMTIREHLLQLYNDKSNEDWRKIPEANIPYVGNLIDYLLTKFSERYNPGAAEALRRAKLASEFRPKYIEENIIDACIQAHVKDMPPHSIEQIVEELKHKKGHRFFAVETARRWANDKQKRAVAETQPQNPPVANKRVKKEPADNKK